MRRPSLFFIPVLDEQLGISCENVLLSLLVNLCACFNLQNLFF